MPYKNATGQYKSSYAVVKQIRNLVYSIPKDDGIKKNVTINLYLSNGDILYGTNRGNINIGTVQRSLIMGWDSVGVVGAYISISSLESSRTPIQIKTTENQQLICQQLRTYDIVKIEADGVSFDVRGLRSAATFDAMFDALAAKTGKGHLYRSSGTSSSSTSISSGPSASCELGAVAVFSDGAIRCRVDNLQIFGGKGKNVEVNAIFENTALDTYSVGLINKMSVPYEDATYETVRIKGDIDDLREIMRNNRGRFKVYAEVVVGNRVIYNSNPKYVTIYNDRGSWRRD